MQYFYLKKINEVKKQKETLEKELNVKISITGKKIAVSGKALDEYEASIIFDAINIGFSIRTALLLKDPDFSFREILIKDFTRRKNMEVIKGRLIGKHGRTKKTIEKISDCAIMIKDNSVGIIGHSENIEYAITAITNIIRGSKQSNVYSYLEKINREKNKK